MSKLRTRAIGAGYAIFASATIAGMAFAGTCQPARQDPPTHPTRVQCGYTCEVVYTVGKLPVTQTGEPAGTTCYQYRVPQAGVSTIRINATACAVPGLDCGDATNQCYQAYELQNASQTAPGNALQRAFLQQTGAPQHDECVSPGGAYLPGIFHVFNCVRNTAAESCEENRCSRSDSSPRIDSASAPRSASAMLAPTVPSLEFAELYSEGVPGISPSPLTEATVLPSSQFDIDGSGSGVPEGSFSINGLCKGCSAQLVRLNLTVPSFQAHGYTVDNLHITSFHPVPMTISGRGRISIPLLDHGVMVTFDIDGEHYHEYMGSANPIVGQYDETNHLVSLVIDLDTSWNMGSGTARIQGTIEASVP